MKFVRVDNGTSSSCTIRLDLEDMRLELKSSTGEVIPEDKIALLLDFPSSTFKNINKPDPIAWNNIFSLPEKFFATLTEQERIKLATLYATCNGAMMVVLNEPTVSSDTLLALEAKLSSYIADLDRQIDLVPKLIKFAEANITFPNMNGVGERPQDSHEMTFYRDDTLLLNTLSILGKVLMPIFTTFMDKCRMHLRNDLKEVHCATLLKDIIHNRLSAIAAKLVGYVVGLSKSNTTNLTPTQIYVGSTPLNVIEKSYASLLVKKLVSVDITKKSNIAIYLSTCIRSNNSNSNKSSKGSALNMFTPNDDAPGSLMGGDDGNTSILEAEAMVSSKTDDCDIIIAEAVKHVRSQFTLDYDLDMDDLEKLENYYRVNHITTTKFNTYMCSLVFGDYILGAKSTELLTNDALISLVSLLQLYLLAQGEPYSDLVHLLTAVPTETYKARMSGVDVQVRASYMNTYEYRNCCERYNLIFDNLDWSTGLRGFIDELTSRVYTTNTAPLIYEKLNMESLNGSSIETPLSVGKALCALALTV